MFYSEILHYSVSITIFYWVVVIVYDWPKLACIVPSNGLFKAIFTLCYLIYYSKLPT